MKLGRRTAFDLTVEQETHFWRAAGIARFAWNWGLARWNEDDAKARAEPDLVKRKALWPSTAKLKAEWAEVRRIEFPWSLEVTKCAGTQSLMDLGATFARAHAERREARTQGRKPRKQFGFPRFKARNKVVPGFALWNDQFQLCAVHSVFGRSHSTVRVPSLGTVRLREVVPAVGGILGARVSYRRGRWFFALQFDLDWVDGERSDKSARLAQGKARRAAIANGMDEDEAKETITVETGRGARLLPHHPNPGTVGGADLGLIDILVGRVERVGESAAPVAVFRDANPRRLSRTEKQQRTRRRRERKLSRSILKARTRVAQAAKLARGDEAPVTGADLAAVRLRLSNRQRRQSKRLAKDTWATADLRNDFLHKLSHGVSRSAEIVVLEDLHVRGMLANRSLAKSMSDAALGRLATFVAYKSEREGGLALWAPRFFPSTKRCSACGLVEAEMSLTDRDWTCAGCGTVHDRDANAAANLCWLGQLAAADGPLPADAQAWAEWVDEARGRVSAWRAAKALSRNFSFAGIVGTACPEGTRGETADRARRNPGRGAVGEPRTTQDRAKPGRGERIHLRSPSG